MYNFILSSAEFRFLGAFAYSRQARISFVKAERLSVLPSVHLFTCVSVAHTGRISVKFDSGDSEEDLSRNSRFDWERTKMWSPLHEDLSNFDYCLRHFVAIKTFLCNIQFLYCWQWHVSQQYTQNVLLPFNCNSGYTNAPLCYVIRAFRILLKLDTAV